MNSMKKMNNKKNNKNNADKMQLLKLKHRAELVNLKPETLAKIHNRSLRRIYDVFQGRAVELLPKVIRTIERYEKKIQATSSN